LTIAALNTGPYLEGTNMMTGFEHMKSWVAAQFNDSGSHDFGVPLS
jgi:hypothetical protein